MSTYTTTSDNSGASNSSTDTHAWNDSKLTATLTDSTDTSPHVGNEGYSNHTRHAEGTRGGSQGTETQSVTLAGNKAAAKITSNSAFFDESFDDSTWDTSGTSQVHGQSTVADRRNGSATSEYSSSHTLDQWGFAHGGSFSASSTEKESSEEKGQNYFILGGRPRTWVVK